MSEIKKTMTLGGVALALAFLAIVTKPRTVTPDAFLDRGEVFFPGLDDPAKAKSLEVIEFDATAGTARPFRVQVRNNIWTIPSHHDYPADGKERLARTAAAIIDLKREDLRSSSAEDYPSCGVVDPLEESASNLEGRGQRVTLKGDNDAPLADIIIGKELPDRKGYHFVRLPGEKRVYVAHLDLDISTKFQDWIEKDLLQIDRDAVDQVDIHDYSVNERTLSLEERDNIVLTKSGSSWSVNNATPNQEVDSSKMSTLVGAIDDLQIVGVRAKPAGLTASLRRADQGAGMSQEDLLSLQSRGYYMAQDGTLKSNDGDLQVKISNGVFYTLRFGEVVYGSDDDVGAGNEKSDDSTVGPGTNRYLFITAELAPEATKEPPVPSDGAFASKPEKDWTQEDRDNRDLDARHKEWTARFAAPRATADEQNQRFAGWYYVISSATYDKIKLKRKDLVKARQPS